MELLTVNNQTELTISNQSVQETNDLHKSTTAPDEIVSRNLNNKKLKKRDKSPNSDETNTSNNKNNLILSNNNHQQQLAPVSTNLPAPSTNSLTIIKKEKQRPETWNKIEQQIFFTALRQNGKNFESITQYFNARQKRYRLENHDGSSIQRSKEQIRHFYYRTWHKIIKYISMPMLNTNKSTANANSNNTNKIIMNDSTTFSLRDIQVKCLIAYNTLMNKSQRWNKKSALKLVELINQGWTTIREKGKITRLRMPLCKISSKTINPTTTTTNSTSNISDSLNLNHNNSNTNHHHNQNNHNHQTNNLTSNTSENLPYPRTIQIRLEPKNEHSYCKVHRLAQNPYLNIEIETHKTVKFLFEFLENKWKDRRNQFLEKFQIDIKKSKTTSTESESEASKKTSTNNSSCYQSNEKLVIYPSESHHIVNSIDFSESSTSSILKLYEEPRETNVTQEEIKKFIENDDETMMVDDYALIAAKNQPRPTTLTTSNNQTQNKKQINPTLNLYNLNGSQLKQGITWQTSHLTSSLTKENKDLTFVQIFYALNKPDLIKLEYDWMSNVKHTLLASNETTNNNNNTESVFKMSSLIFNQNQRQRFYIDTLASVAASFLKDLQNNNTNTKSNVNTTSSNQQSQQQKSPPKQQQQQQPLQIVNVNNTKLQPQVNQSLAIIQPPSDTATTSTQSNQQKTSSTTTHILPLDTVLQRLNEEQSNKTKKLLADLNQTKRRSRHRKQIMVVNTSNSSSIRNVILPKLNFINNNQQINLDLTGCDNNQQQNIVLSGPVAAVARQIVNTTSLTNNNSSNSSATTLPTVSHITNIGFNGSNISSLIGQNQTNVVYPKTTSDNNNFIIVGNYQEQQIQTSSTSTSQLVEAFDTNTNYSNLMPQFLASLTSIAIENSCSSNSNQNDTNLNLNNHLESDNNLVSGEMVGSPQTLADMSLLDLSINNADSLFGPPIKANTINKSLNENNLDESGSGSVGTSSGAFSGVSLLKMDKNSNKSSNNLLGNYSLTKQRSDIIVEWTDSMNDVSLTGILNEFQSPDKHQSQNTKSTALVHVLNENSRDSIFFNMDTIMDINNHTSI